MTQTLHSLIDLFAGGMGWILFLVQLLGWLLAARVIRSERSTEGTIAWAIGLSTVAPVAVPLYLFFGINRFSGYRRARRARNHEFNQVMRGLELLRPQTIGAHSGPRSAWRVFEKLAHLPFTRGNRVELLVDGAATFDSIFRGIEQAQSYILVEFYILRDDELGRALRDRLCAQARAGRTVRLIYDEIGSQGLPMSYLKSLTDAGVRVTEFGTTRGGGLNRFRINFRNHRKIVIVDGRIGWLGGHNVGDEYMGHSPQFGACRDTHVKIEGPAVTCLQVAFVEDWYWASGEIPALNWEIPRAEDGGLPVLILPSGPADEQHTCQLAFLNAIAQARDRIWIHSPYFVPDEEIVAALQLATLRGVDVRILIPERPDHRLVWLASFHFLNLPALRRVHFYRYQPGFLHSKALVVDERVAAIGTANFDNRSMRINFEVTAIVADSSFARTVAQMMERDFAQSRRVDHREYEQRPTWFQILVSAIRLVSPIL